MVDKLWFGHARGHMQYVPCPLIDSSVTRNRYVETIRFENGGGDGRRSAQYQMQYDLVFSGLAHELEGIDAFNKFAQGYYGNDLIYLAHPATFETNMFPAGWATPSLSEQGWGKISSDAVAYADADGPSVTNLVTNPSMEAVASGTDSTKRVNLVTNPSFESNTTGWTSTGATISRVTTDFYIGTASLSTVCPANGNWAGTSAPITVAPNTVYTSSIYVKGEAGKTFQLQFDDYTSADVYIASLSSAVITATGTWQRVSVTRTLGATSAKGYIYVFNRTAGAHTFYLDGAMCETASDMRPYFDGNYSEDPNYIPEWNGTVNNSTSDALVRGASNRENLVTNPNFEVDLTGWGGTVTRTRITTDQYVGTASLQCVASVFDAYAESPQGSVFGNTSYTASIWIKGEVGKLIGIGISDFNSSGTYLGGNVSSNFIMTGSWQRIRFTRTTLASAARASIFIQNKSASAHTFFVDAVMLEQTTTLNPYFDGGYTDMPGWTTSWAGTANASRSVATAAPVTVRTNLVTNPSMESVTAGSVVMRRNLVTNPSFESGTTGWSVNGLATLAQSTVQKYAGSNSLLVTRTGDTDDFVSFTVSGLNPGATYTGSFYVYITGNGATRNDRGILVFGGTGGGIAEANYDRTKVNQWQRVSASTTAGTSGTIQIRAYAMTGFNIFIDAVMLEASSTIGDYFDGSTPDALGWDYAWSGTANASISTAASAATTVRTNLITNPSFETDVVGWNQGTNTTRARVTTEFYTGTASMQAICTAQTSAVSNSASVSINTTYTLSVYLKGEAGKVFRIRLLEYNNGSTYVGENTSGDITATGSWQRVSVTRAFGATGNTAIIAVDNRTVGAHTFYVDAVLLEASSTVGDYFDGSFNPAGDFSYAWTGTANASTSIQRGATPAGWFTQYAGTTISSNAQQYVGSRSIRFDASLQFGNCVIDSTVTASQTYTGSAWVKGESGKQIYLELEERTAGGAVVGTAYTSPITATGSWQRLSTSRTFGSTGVTARLRIATNTANHTIYVDAAMVEASPIVQDYFDGSIVSADADLTNSWTGTAHASTSVMRGVQVRTTATGTAGQKIDYQTVSSPAAGSKAYRAYLITTAAIGIAPQDFTVTSGSTYTLFMKVRANNRNQFVTPRLQSTLGAGVTLTQGVWTTIKQTIVAGGGTSAFTGLLIAASSGHQVGDTIDIDSMMIVQGAYTGDYFDGNSTDSGNTTYAWTGTANSSTSTMLSEMVLYGNPRRAATYTVTNINVPPTKVCTLVIPPTHTLYLGASGTSTGSAGVFIRPIQASDSLYYGPLEELTLLDPNGSVRMNKTLNGATYQAVEIFLMKTDTNPGTVTLNSMMAQLYKTGTTPALPSNHYQGEGSTGLMFADDAIVETYQYMYPPRKGIATKLIEVEAWR